MLQSYWYIACRAKDLSRTLVAITVLGKAIVLFRDGEGSPKALEDRCAHRNAPLSLGTLRNGVLQCAYHGWCYNAEGAVVDIPAQPADDICPSFNIATYPCVEQDGYIWICPSTTPAHDLPFLFPYLGQPGWNGFHMKTRFNATVESCLENFLDCPHASFVHRGWFRTPTAKQVRAIVRTLPDGVEAEYFEEPRARSLVWWLLSPKKTQMRHTDRFIAPASSRVDYIFSNGAHFVISSACTPINDTETEVYTVITYHSPMWGKFLQLFFEPLSRLIIRQDVRMLGHQQANIHRFGEMAFHSTAQDLLGGYIVAWRQAIKNKTPLPPAGAEQHVEMRL